MKRKEYLLLYIFEVILLLIVGLFQKAPGYMDAEYYFYGGRQLAQGAGFYEDFLWNYLDDPQGLPHPSHGYWMPLASMLAALGMVIGNSTSFVWGRVLFILLAGAIPPMSAALSFHMFNRHDYALLSGFLSALPGFYLSYIGTTDTFGISMILGGLFFMLVGVGEKASNAVNTSIVFWGLGLLAGLSHLSRVDGILWLFIVMIYIIMHSYEKRGGQSPKRLIATTTSHFLVSMIGYLLIMGPWMVRNFHEFGSLLSPGGMKALWITDYNELYVYPASILNITHWVNSGITEIIKTRLSAGWLNLQSAFAVEGVIFLSPLMIWGLWKTRSMIQVKLAVIAWAGIFVIMTVIFPFQGGRGGFFHSSSALQPLLWIMTPVGFDAFISWGKRVRRWNYSQAKKVFQAGMLGLVCLISVAMVSKRVIGGNLAEPQWNQSYHYYAHLAERIDRIDIMPADIMMVNNPPGFYLASNRPCIAIPDGNLEQVFQAANRYNAQYLILEANHPEGLIELYENPGNRTGLEYIFSYDGAYIYQLERDQ